MPDSILDKVLSSKENQEKQDFRPLEVVHTILKTLASKEADILKRRYGLQKDGRETLETIGSFYNVTRERIRQIESQSIAKMKSSALFAEVLKPVEHLLITLLHAHGGVMCKDMLFENVLSVQKNDAQEREAVSFILSELLDEKITELPKSKKYSAGWKLKLSSLDFLDATIDECIAIIKKVGVPQAFEELYEQFTHTPFYQQNEYKLSEDAVLSSIEVSAVIGKNPFNEYGLTSWGLILPKRMNDRVYLVLKKEGKPMHFEDIAEQITKIFKKRAYPPTVHNELILNKEYVLVGRGIYALQEWGFKEGVVASVIADLLAIDGKPLTRAEIVEKVLEQRIVKKNTIHLALTDKHLFHKTPDGKYALLPQSDHSS